jgi:hypothetical protein
MLKTKHKQKNLLESKQDECIILRKGRSSKLIHLRDIFLMKRYYDLSEVKRIRLDDVLHILSTKEFFISEQRIWSIVRSNTDMLDTLARGEEIDVPGPDTKDKDQLTLFS